VTARDRERWDARHAAVDDDVPAPPDELRGGSLPLPAGGRAIDVACGRGAVAVWLAARGFEVDAVDVSAVGLAAAAALARRRGLADRVRCWPHDLDTGLPDGCVGPYDLVICQRFRDPELYPQLLGRLAAGGVLVVTVLSVVGAESGPWRAAPGELRAAFSALEVLAEREANGEAGIVARRPVPRSAPPARSAGPGPAGVPAQPP
jgi:SAM-dependent methyltransferase